MNKKLNIVFVIDFIDGNGGGIVSTRRFISGLRKKGHKITLITTGKEKKDRIILKHYYPPFAENIMKSMNSTMAIPDDKLIYKTIKDADIVHIFLPFYLGISTINISNMINKPIITSFHVQAENITKNLNLNYKYIIKKIYKFFIKYFYDKSDVVICPSKFAKNELIRYGLKTKTKVITNGFPKEFKHINIKTKNKQFTILNVGRLAKAKNQKLLITAISKIKEKDKIKLNFVGKGPMKKELIKYAKDKNVNANFLGTISKKKLINLYNTSDLLIHYGEVELEGMAVLEALACLTNVLIYNVNTSASPQFAITKKNLFSNEKDLINKIKYWINHKDLFETKIKPKQKEFIKNYSLDYAIDLLENTYYKTIKNKHKKEKTNSNKKMWTYFLDYLANKKNNLKKTISKKLKKIKINSI